MIISRTRFLSLELLPSVSIRCELFAAEQEQNYLISVYVLIVSPGVKHGKLHGCCPHREVDRIMKSLTLIEEQAARIVAARSY